MRQQTTRFRRRGIAVGIAMGILTLSAGQAFAQSADPAKEDRPAQSKPADEPKELPVITVTATRLDSDLMKTPVAVTAVTQDALTREGIRDVRGLSGTMPNLQIATGADSGVQINIRGIGANNFTEIGDPAVGLHVAGLYSPRPQGALTLMFDVDQVEVLRPRRPSLPGRARFLSSMGRCSRSRRMSFRDGTR